MDYRGLIKEAWQFTQANKRMMKWYAFLPAIISTIAGVGFVLYQYFAFTYHEINADGSVKSFIRIAIGRTIEYFENHPDHITPAIIIVAIGAFFYFFVPIFSTGAMIQLIARKRNGQEVKLLNGITYGLAPFLPLFEYGLFIKTFSMMGVVTETFFILRNLGTEAVMLLTPILTFVFLAGLFVSVFFTFVEAFIVIDDENMFSAMRKSMSLVFYNWQHTFLILILLFVISIRVILNLLLVIIIPALVFGGVGIFAALAFHDLIMYVAIILSLGSIYLAGYLGGTLNLFSHAVWTFAFLDLTTKGFESAREMGSSTEIEFE